MKLLLATADGVAVLAEDPANAVPVGVIMGDDVALHRLQLLETAPKKRLAEARIRATDLAAQPLDELHIALSEPGPDGRCWLALIERNRMAGHLAHFGRHGPVPECLIPAALLLPVPDGPHSSSASLQGLLLVRGSDFATATDKALAPALDCDGEVAPFSIAANAPLALNLRQGEFAPRQRWWLQRGFQIAAGVLLLLVALLAAAPAAIGALRSSGGVALADRSTMALATRALGKTPVSAESAAQALATARRSAEGQAIGPRLTFLSATLEAVPGARADAIRMAPDSMLLITLGGPAGPLTSAGNRLTAGPFEAKVEGRELKLGDRRTARATTDSALPVALARAITAQSDAVLVKVGAASGRRIDAAGIARAFAAAGLEITPAGRIEAARSAALLPLLAQLEAKGARFTRLTITRNEDQTLAADIGFAP